MDVAVRKETLGRLGMERFGAVHENLPPARLVEAAVRRREGMLAGNGALVAKTGKRTGRSPKDRFIVEDDVTRNRVAWGATNKPFSSEAFGAILEKATGYLANLEEFYVVDAFAGADPRYRRNVQVACEAAWHALFARQLFRRPSRAELETFEPDWTVVSVPGFLAEPEEDGTESETFVGLDFSRKVVLVCGTGYAGEIKKSIFTVLNFVLPIEHDVFPMHCSANMGEDDSVALFFGLSGTGKTTLSADPERYLIGDDEHGWSDTAVFNFEGGCYAKMIRLSEEAEPEIYATTRRFGTVLENVVMDPDTRELDLDDNSKGENTRGAYPIDYIPNTSAENMGPPPRNIVMLTADAFGVLPPIARLTPDQAMYHFLSGYTAKVAGTEIGVTEPEATFSTCFGAPFMPRHPSVYGNLLKERIARGNVDCWLVNTGWTGGKYGVGKRMPIKATRALLNAALDGSLKNAEFRRDPYFGFDVPIAVPSIDSTILNPRDTWADKDEYDATARKLVGLFIDNFAKFETHVDQSVKEAAPTAA